MRPLPKLELLRAPTSEAQLGVMHDDVRTRAENRPGVYRMLTDAGEVVYVGKSKRVRTRLLSYFRCSFPEEKGARILREADRIEEIQEEAEADGRLAEEADRRRAVAGD